MIDYAPIGPIGDMQPAGEDSLGHTAQKLICQKYEALIVMRIEAK